VRPTPGQLRALLPIDGDDERLERRYMETRWRYPRAGDDPIVDRIRLERQVVLRCPTALIW
jgi:RNase adaptor protein for sRNA GlmZ degradation